MKRCLICAVICFIMFPLSGTARKRTVAKPRENNHSALLYCREFGPYDKGFIYLFCDTLNRTFVFMENNNEGISSAEYGTCRINGDTLVLTPVIYSDTFLRFQEYVKANTDLSDEQIDEEIEMLCYGKGWPKRRPSDIVNSLYDKWFDSLRFQPVERPVFRIRDSLYNHIANYTEYRYLIKRNKLINITDKKAYSKTNMWQQDLFRVDLPVPDEKEVAEKYVIIVS